MAVVALFYGVAHWNDFFAATLYLNDASKWPIQLVLRQYVLQGSALASAVESRREPGAATGAVDPDGGGGAGDPPILLVYPFLQKHVTQGVLSGAIKG